MENSKESKKGPTLSTAPNLRDNSKAIEIEWSKTHSFQCKDDLFCHMSIKAFQSTEIEKGKGKETYIGYSDS